MDKEMAFFVLKADNLVQVLEDVGKFMSASEDEIKQVVLEARLQEGIKLNGEST